VPHSVTERRQLAGRCSTLRSENAIPWPLGLRGARRRYYPGLLMGLGLVGLAWGGGAACPAPPRKQIVVTLRVAEAQPGVRQLRLVEVR